MTPARVPMALLAAGLMVAGLMGADDPAPQPGLISSKFIYDKAPFPSAHASTIAETKSGLLAAWFGGTDEGRPDVGIWTSRDDGQGWTPPVEVAKWDEGGKRLPCWNPVLYQPKGGPLWLFYKAGPTPANWWGMLISSTDDGKTWSAPVRLPDGILGPVKNKPITLKDGTILSPTSFEDKGWRVHFERTNDLGKTWQTVGPVEDDKPWEAIQPTLLVHPNGHIQALSRSQQSKIVECWSPDGGKTWSKLMPTSLPNPDSGIDAVTLADGRHLLLYNPTTKGRTPLNVALSADGQAWKTALILEDKPGEYSYPAVIQTSDGLVHITYTWHRKKIRHVVVDPAKLVTTSP
ncbi:sialidase family protein [Isosphaeraceae bacterium EP7]